MTAIGKSDHSDNKDIVTAKIIKACFDVHNDPGPGFNEKIYNNVLKIVFWNESIIIPPWQSKM